MSATLTYDRPKSVTVNSTGMVCSLLVAEKPDVPGAIGGTGTTGNLDCRIQADADESGGADVQDLFKLETALVVHPTTGVVTLTVTATPIKGGATNGTAKSMAVVHNETMDEWQAAAGRARQA